MHLQDTAVLVTGGASGLGEATVRHLARQGARVAILDIDGDRAGTLAREVGGLALRCDVTDPASAADAIGAARERHGVARVLVNCAGGGKPKRVVGKDGPMPLEDFVKVVNLNLFGGFNMVRLAAADMIAAAPLDGQGERGVVLFTASAAAFEGQVGQSAYAASKGALVALTLQLAREFAQFGVRAMTVAPGVFETPLMANVSPEVMRALIDAAVYPKRLGAPEEFAELVAHVIGNRFLNGEVIRLDGAVRMAPR
nr:SDR family NAD(P)-dependent oxidoreductase [uncultured Duganella sp.]